MSYDNPTSWLSPEFWANIWRGTITWAVQALPKVLIVLLLGFVLLKLVNWGAKRLVAHTSRQSDATNEAAAREHQKRAETLVGILRKSAVIVIWAFVAMLVLMQVGVNVAPLIAGAGIVGLAVGFGAQELVRDVITGFFVLLENHVRKGDVAVINGTGGLVEAIGLRTITLRDLSGTVHVFQNGKISSLANMTKEWSAMVFDISVSDKEDPDEVMEVMREVGENLRAEPSFAARILEPIEVFGLNSFEENSLVIQARLKTIPSEQWNVGREFRRRLKLAFDARGIERPVRSRALYWSDSRDADQVPRPEPRRSEPVRSSARRG
ncbi:MAG TPA: mechanosensitive ion channel family protein [Polyangiaceae bacterium]